MNSGTHSPPAPASNLTRLILALWFIWLGAMIAMSASEWQRPRPIRTTEELRERQAPQPNQE